MPASRPSLTTLVSASLALLLSGSAFAQSDAPAPDWNSTAQQTTSPSLKRQTPARTNRFNETRATAPAAVDQDSQQRMQNMAPSETLQVLRAPPPMDAGQHDPEMVQQTRPDQQIARMQKQIQELQQRLMAAEQTLVSHVHTFDQDTYRKEKYRTMKHFLDNNLEYEYLAPGGRIIQKETSVPMVSNKRPWP